MGLRQTVLGWLRQADTGDKGVVKAEEDLAVREYQEEKTDRLVDSRLGTSGDHFDADESAPR